MEETSLARANVYVMVHDAQTNSWVSSGTGLSRVQFFHNPTSNTYRVVGWDLSDKKVVLNCAIVRGMKYNRARQTFHQWRDSKQQVYGLNFTSAEDAETFATAVEKSLEQLNVSFQKQQQTEQVNATQAAPQVARVPSAQQFPPPKEPAQPPYMPSIDQQGPPPMAARTDASPAAYRPATNQHLVSGEYMQPRAPPTRSDYNDIAAHPHPTANGAPMANGVETGNPYNTDPRFQSSSDDSTKGVIPSVCVQPKEPRQPEFNPRDSSASSCPAQEVPQAINNNIPPPPPLPTVSSSASYSQNRLSRPSHRSFDTQSSSDISGDHDDDADAQGGLATELRAARQLRSRAASTAGGCMEPQQSATLGRTTGVDMMSDLQRVLAARRRAQQEGDATASPSGAGGASGDKPVPSDETSARTKSTNSLQDSSVSATSTLPSYATLRKNTDSTARQPPPLSSGPAATPNKTASTVAPVSRADLEAFKRELLTEFRREVQQLKNDVIEALRSSANRT